MKGLAELVVSLCDLCEAEGRLLEAGILRTVRRAALLSLGLLFGAGALALFLAALYALLTSFLPRPAAMALLGGASAAIAGVLLWSARSGAQPDAGVQKEEGRPGKTGAGGTVPSPQRAAQAASKPARTRPAEHGPWAGVPPYGHRGAAGAPAEHGKASCPHGGARTQEDR